MKYHYNPDCGAVMFLAMVVLYVVKDHFDISMTYPVTLISYLIVGLSASVICSWLDGAFS